MIFYIESSYSKVAQKYEKFWGVLTSPLNFLSGRKQSSVKTHCEEFHQYLDKLKELFLFFYKTSKRSKVFIRSPPTTNFILHFSCNVAVAAFFCRILRSDILTKFLNDFFAKKLTQMKAYLTKMQT